VLLNSFPEAQVLATASTISADGATLLGTYSQISPYRAWTWTAASGVHFLPDLPGGTLGSQLPIISADGQVIFGRGSSVTDLPLIAWRGEQLPTLVAGSQFWGTPVASSSDGAVVVANFSGAWRIRDGIRQSLVGGPASVLSVVTAMSNDGFRVVGRSGLDAAMWDPLNGVRRLADVLNLSGVPVGSWALSAPIISGDGTMIAGIASDRDSALVAIYRIHLPIASCYPNCDKGDTFPALNVNDFICFLNKFAAGDPYANCDGSTAPPVLSANDFQCFLNSFGRGCT